MVNYLFIKLVDFISSSLGKYQVVLFQNGNKFIDTFITSSMIRNILYV